MQVPSSLKAERSTPSSPEPSARELPESEDELLADAFWSTCKQGPPPPPPPVAKPLSRPSRTSARLRKPIGLSAAPRSTVESPAPPPREEADDRGHHASEKTQQWPPFFLGKQLKK
eukprot:g27003.t1